MLIRIDKSVTSFISENISSLNSFSSEILAINYIAGAFLDSEHLIIADIDVLEYLSQCQLLEPNAKSIYEYLKNRFYSLGMYEDLFSVELFVCKGIYECERIESEGRNIFNISVEKLSKRRYLNQTCLISEHKSDCEFYVKLARKFIQENDKFKNLNINLSFENILGGGSTSCDAYSDHIEQGKFCLAIADNDKSYPEDKIGTTLGSLKTVFDRYSKNSVIGIHELSVREKENLIPPSFYLMSTNSSCKISLDKLYKIEKSVKHQEKLKYLDIKSGVKAEKYKTDVKFKSYYEELFKDIDDLICCTIEEIDNLDDNDLLFKGIGSLINNVEYEIIECRLKDVLEEKLKLGCVPENVIDSIKKNVDINNSLLKILPDYLKSEWNNLCETVISWGCCSPDSIFIA